MCIDNDSSVTRSDMGFIDILQKIFVNNQFDQNKKKDLNVFLLNLVWKLNLYYCRRCIPTDIQLEEESVKFVFRFFV